MLCQFDILLILSCCFFCNIANLVIATSLKFFSSSSFLKQLFITNFFNKSFTCDHHAFLKENLNLFKLNIWDFSFCFIFLIFQSFFNILKRVWMFKINKHVVLLCWFQFWCWEFFINWDFNQEESSVIYMIICFSSALKAMFLLNWNLLRKVKVQSRWLLNLKDFRVLNSNWSNRQFYY